MLVVSYDTVDSGFIVASIVISTREMLPARYETTTRVSLKEHRVLIESSLLPLHLRVLFTSSREVKAEPCFYFIWLGNVLIALIRVDLDDSALFLVVRTSFLRGTSKFVLVYGRCVN